MYNVQVVCQKRIPNLSFNICVLGAIGIDCSSQGISSSNKSTSATQASSNDGKNHAEFHNLDLHINHLPALFLCQDK